MHLYPLHQGFRRAVFADYVQNYIIILPVLVIMIVLDHAGPYQNYAIQGGGDVLQASTSLVIGQ